MCCQILRLFSESADSITGLNGEMSEAKKLLGRKNQHLGQLWYRSLTLRHVISLLDQVEDVAKVSGHTSPVTIMYYSLAATLH